MAKVGGVKTQRVAIPSPPQETKVSKKAGDYQGHPVHKASSKGRNVATELHSTKTQHRKIQTQKSRNIFQAIISGANDMVKKGVKIVENSNSAKRVYDGIKEVGKNLAQGFETARKIVSQSVQDTKKQLQIQKDTEAQRQMDINNLYEKVRQSGLSEAEAAKLRNNISSLSGNEQSREIRFLEEILQSPNAIRALRTYITLRDCERDNPSRITRDIVHTLTRGVSEPRTTTTQGREGILGRNEALAAADALIRMPQSEYQRVTSLLTRAGQRDDGTIPANASAQTERALILNAVAARKDELGNPSLWNRILMLVGYPSTHMRDIEQYAARIRSQPSEELIRRSTVLDLDGDAEVEALQQRFTTSCTPTAQQMARAEADPIYAWQLHEETIHSLQSEGNIADEQRRLLQVHGGTAVARNGGVGVGRGMWPEDTLNTFVGQYSNETYTRNNINNSVNSRRDALNRIDPLLRGGTDIPIVVAWNGGRSHSMLITDVRGSGNDREYLVSDPWTGRTDWISGQDIINGNTNFFSTLQEGVKYFL